MTKTYLRIVVFLCRDIPNNVFNKANSLYKHDLGNNSMIGIIYLIDFFSGKGGVDRLL